MIKKRINKMNFKLYAIKSFYYKFKVIFPRSIMLNHKLGLQLLDHAPNYISPMVKKLNFLF